MTYIDILAKLIAFDTTTSKDTLEAATWVEQYLKNCGMSVRLIYNQSKTRASVVASFTGNSSDGNVVFCGHLDVVPANCQVWNTNPFVLTQKNNLFFGRGTADMKGSIAVMLSLVPSFVRRKKSFMIILTHNEEIAGAGIREVLADKATLEFVKKAEGCMVLEPTLSNVVLGHKTASSVSIEIKGKSAHSSTPESAVNALFYAVEIYKIFYQLSALFSKKRDNDFDVPYSVADVLILNGGKAINVMPDTANLTYTCRFLSEKEEKTFLDELEKQICNYVKSINGLSVRFYNKVHIPALEMDEKVDFVQKAAQCFGFAKNKKVSFATEAGYFSLLGVPTVVCGSGNIAQAHQDNEFVEAEQLACFYEKLNKFWA